MAAEWKDAIARAQAHAPFLSRAMERLPALTDLLASGDDEAALAMSRAAGERCENVGVALRRERLALALTLAIGDLAGAIPLARVTGELSDFADRALDAAIADAIRRRAPDAPPAGMIALALGKHGAGELNYSSDIDPILLFDPATLPRRERDEPGEAAQRYARWIVETLSTYTEEGYVFRVDLRLRPASEVSPLAIPVGGALSHYESSALAWERAAFIRARACAGDIAAGEDFLRAIRPFVWRKSLDFGAIAEIGRLTRQIRASHKGTGAPGPGFDVKRGRGGIREIEFYAQTHQLIHGGRNPELRLRGTRATLDALAGAGLIPAGDAHALGEAYDQLRTIEHRLQMVSDQQTHHLPEDAAALDNVARLHGLADGAALIAWVSELTDTVGTRYDELIAASADTSPPPPARSDLAELGPGNADETAARIEGWKAGTFRALRSDAAIAAFERVQPQLLEALATAPDPDRALVRWERLLANLPSAINLFNLLEARPALLDLLARILSLAPPLADELARRADLLDPLIDASAFALPGTVEEIAADLAWREAGDDYERVLGRVRRKVSELRFTLGVQLIEASSDPLAVGAALARVAEAAVQVLGDAARAEFEAVHGKVPGSALAILGLGRMGGGVLTHASDLDLVFLFSGEFSGESDGARPIGATLYFNRLSQRVIAALSVPTAEGALYEIDTRLRPSGEQGPPAASFDSFARYQGEQAWTWEHMALARARAIYGASDDRQRIEAIVRDALRADREIGSLREAVLDMRATMARHKPGKGPLDVKLARGGLVDLEFLVHFLQLRDGAALHPDMSRALEVLVCDGVLPESLPAAHETLSRFLIAARLLAPDGSEPPPSAAQALAKACGYGDWNETKAALAAAREDVARAWQATFGEELEIET